MIENDTITLVGRGPSAFEFTDWDGPIMAVSSGIFALPEGVKPDHIVSMDAIRYFLGELNHHPVAWGMDAAARAWPFWADASIQKHTLLGRVKRGEYRNFPMSQVMEAIPDAAKQPFYEAWEVIQHNFGYQPEWGDYPNVRGWEMPMGGPPNFAPEGPFGLDGLRNSMFFAVQVAHRLGYRRLRFIGMDMKEDLYQPHVEHMERWSRLAAARGFEWVNLSDQSAVDFGRAA